MYGQAKLLHVIHWLIQNACIKQDESGSYRPKAQLATILEDEGKTEEAIELYKYSVENVPHWDRFILPFEKLAHYYLKIRDYKSARNYIKLGSKLNKNHTGLVLLTSELELELGNAEKSKKSAQKCLKLFEKEFKQGGRVQDHEYEDYAKAALLTGDADTVAGVMKIIKERKPEIYNTLSRNELTDNTSL
jgi:tetratricopeptide (TPR) repeat protein